MAGYIFGAGTGETPESIARKRKIAEALQSRGRAPRNLGEGLSSFGGDIASALLSRQADKREKAGQEAFGQEWDGMFKPPTDKINSVDDLWARSTGAGVGPTPQPDLAQLMALSKNAGFGTPMQQQVLSALIGKKLDPQTSKPVALSPGSVLVDPATGKQIAQGNEKPQGVQDRAVAAFMAANPGATEFDALTALRKAGASQSNSTVNMPPGETAFQKASGTFQAGLFGDMVTDGMAARDQVAQINRLGELLDTQQGGFRSWAAAAGARFGVEIGENANEAQAAEALIAKLVPAQRVPGSGTTSDFDAKNFAKSMPALMGLPGGNQMIMETMRKLAAQRVTRGDIASQVMTNEITRDEGLRRLNALPSPFPSKDEIAAIERQKRQEAADTPGAPIIDRIRGAERFKYTPPGGN